MERVREYMRAAKAAGRREFSPDENPCSEWGGTLWNIEILALIAAVLYSYHGLAVC